MSAAESSSLELALRGVFADLSLPATDAAMDRLLAYLALLQRWNATYNLTSVRDPAQMLSQHLADSLAVIPPLRREFDGRPGLRLLDVGSGGGLPGVVIAVMQPDWHVTCVDTVGKKAAFVQQVAVELGLRNLASTHARVEQMRDAAFDVIVSRAFSSLPQFVSLSRSRLAVNGRWVAMKGKRPGDEIDALQPDVEMFHVEQLTVPLLDAERCLVWMRPRH